MPTSGTIPANWPAFIIEPDSYGWDLERVRDGARHPTTGNTPILPLDRLTVGEMYRLVKAGCSSSGVYVATEAVDDPSSLGTLTLERVNLVYGTNADGTVWTTRLRAFLFAPAPEMLPFAEVMRWDLVIDERVSQGSLPIEERRILLPCEAAMRAEGRATWPFFGMDFATSTVELGSCADAVAVDVDGNELTAEEEASFLMRLEAQRDAGIVNDGGVDGGAVIDGSVEIDGGAVIAADAASFDAGTTTYGRDGSMWADGAFAEHGLGHNDCAAQPAAPRRAPLALFALLGWVIARRRSRR